MNTVQGPSRFRVGLRLPTIFTLLSLIFLYVLQYPLSRLFLEAPEATYGLDAWIAAYAFVIYSSIILLVFLRLGIRGPAVVILPTPQFFGSRLKSVPLLIAGFIVFLFFMWSQLMRDLKIGMTIYADFDPLPYRLVGVLFYGRLVVQPLILSYIARGYAEYRWKKIVLFVLLAGLGAWTALTSGSRFTGIMFALPYLLLINGKSRYAVFGVMAAVFVTIATLTRHFYLPFYISEEYIQIYANQEYQESIMSGVSTIAIGYLVGRTMGIAEMLLAFDYGAITPSFSDAFLALLSYFSKIPFSFSGASIKNIYGLSDDAFGGFGLGLFPNYWVLLGGNLATYTVGIAFAAYMLGKSYRYSCIALARFGFADGASLFFIILFFFLFDARANIFPPLLVIAWVFSRPNMPKLIYALLPKRRRKFAEQLSPSVLVAARR